MADGQTIACASMGAHETTPASGGGASMQAQLSKTEASVPPSGIAPSELAASAVRPASPSSLRV